MFGFGEARETETSRRFRGPGECNGCENECQGVAPESSRQAVPILRTLRFPSVILEDSTFAIAIINITFYFSTTLASVYASSVRQAVCIICRIIALYSENAAETISEGLKSKIFMGYSPTSLVRTLRVHLCAAGNSPANFCLHPYIYKIVHCKENFTSNTVFIFVVFLLILFHCSFSYIKNEKKFFK